ncbi:exocyst complex component 1-like [Bolinopsis microptera]|uniref:exocyst complex component 1-like n=1 Tax=Bolinopsis microptera TaxID=2820187 RepID=UPI00307918A5
MATKHGSRGKNQQTISSIIGENEKIIEIVNATSITKDKTKAKRCFIVVTHLKGSHLNYSIFVINQSKDVLKLRYRFALIELNAVDFLASDDSRLDFLLKFNEDKVLHYACDAWEKKKKFLINLYKLCKNKLPKEALPVFKNVNTQMLEETVFLSATLKGMENDSPNPSENVEPEYKLKYLTKEEELDLEQVCKACQWETESAEEFIAKITMELSGLDKANIHSIMNVEEEILKLFETMDDAIKKLDTLDESLNEYSEILTREESRILDISDLSSNHSVRVANNQKLLQKTQDLLQLLSLPVNLEDLDTLNDYNLESFSQAVEVAQSRVDALAGHELQELHCVQEFMINCRAFLKTVPELLYADLDEKLRKDWQGKHRARHINVARFTSLLNWCKDFDPVMFNAIFQSYEASIQKCYAKEISNFFKDKVGTIQKRSNLDKGFSFAGKSNSSTSTMDISASKQSFRGSLSNIRGSIGSVDSVNIKGSGDSMATYQTQSENNSKFDNLFCKVLDFITPLVVDEEDHLNEVFGIPFMEDIPTDASDNEIRTRKDENTATNNILIKLFGAKLDQELQQLIEVSYKVDPYYSLYMYLRLGKPSHNQEGSVFLKRFYSSCLIIVKRQFDQFIKNQVAQIGETKAHKSKRCGILHCVHKYEHFVRDTERLFDRKLERRTEIEKGYITLLEAVFFAIDRISKEQQKVPPEVVMIENYHHLTELMKSMSLSCLSELQRKAAKLYETNLNEYVTVKLGNPIEKISAFFLGVKQSLSSAVRPEEVGFQINYSRSVLKSIIKQYPLKDVRRSIENYLNKIEKHLCEEEDMYERVGSTYCHSILSQVTEYQGLMKSCYPDSGVQFEFREEDIRRLFDVRISQKKGSSV